MRYEPSVRERALERFREVGLGEAHRRMIALAAGARRILELGCATGYVSRELRRAGARVVGVELDPVLADAAREHVDELIIGDIERPEVQESISGSFDLVLMGDLLEHLVDPGAVLRWARGLLEPGGAVLVTIPNVAFYTMRWSLLRGRFEYTECGLLDATHLRFYTFHSFQRLAVASGYRVEEYWITEGRMPLRRLWARLPLIGRWLQRIEPRLVARRPNLLGSHFLFRLVPAEEG
jgi:SAM-dependent methyltransferase